MHAAAYWRFQCYHYSTAGTRPTITWLHWTSRSNDGPGQQCLHILPINDQIACWKTISKAIASWWESWLTMKWCCKAPLRYSGTIFWWYQDHEIYGTSGYRNTSSTAILLFGTCSYLYKHWCQTYGYIDFFHDHSHITVFNDQCSSFLNITASIVQGSVIGPASYVVTAGDLAAATAGNSLCKFADDTYLVIPASNKASRQVELANIRAWANRNNLRLNCSKSCEVIFSDSRRRGIGVYHRRRHCQESHAAAVWRCWELILQATSPFRNTSSS